MAAFQWFRHKAAGPQSAPYRTPFRGVPSFFLREAAWMLEAEPFSANAGII